MTDTPQPSPHRWQINITSVSITAALMVVTSMATLFYARWDASTEAAEKAGRLSARLELHQNQLDQTQQELSSVRKDLQTTQTALRESELKLYGKTIELEKTKEQVLSMSKLITTLQQRESSLRGELQVANNCRTIQERIAGIESRLERNDAFGYPEHMKNEAKQRLADHQESLRSCLLSVRQ